MRGAGRRWGLRPGQGVGPRLSSRCNGNHCVSEQSSDVVCLAFQQTHWLLR